MSAIQLLHGDCLELMRGIPAGSVDAIITDLPFGVTACHWDTVIPFAPLWAEWKRIIKPRGAVVLFGSQPFFTDVVASNRAWFRYEIVWEKSLATGFLNANRNPMKSHELLGVFYSNLGTYNPQKTKGTPYSATSGTVGDVVRDKTVGGFKTISDGARFPRSVIRFDGEANTEHPTQKPVSLLEYLIRTYTNPGETVLDCTMGSGTTLVACVNTQRNGIGIELDAGYYAIAERRIAEAQMQPALFMEAALC